MGMDGLGLEKSRCFHSWPPHRVSKTWIGGPCRTPNLGGWNVAWIKGDSDRGLPIMECTLWKAWPYYGTHIFRDSIWEFQVSTTKRGVFFRNKSGTAGNGGDGGMVILDVFEKRWALNMRFFSIRSDPKRSMRVTNHSSNPPKFPKYHPKFQVPKMKLLSLIALFWGVGSLTVYIRTAHTTYIGQDSSIFSTWFVCWMDEFW